MCLTGQVLYLSHPEGPLLPPSPNQNQLPTLYRHVHPDCGHSDWPGEFRNGAKLHHCLSVCPRAMSHLLRGTIPKLLQLDEPSVTTDSITLCYIAIPGIQVL
jgi:hypothetical protein